MIESRQHDASPSYVSATSFLLFAWIDKLLESPLAGTGILEVEGSQDLFFLFINWLTMSRYLKV